MMEDSLPEAKFDVAVLSYSLTGVPSAKSADFLNRLMQLSNPGGKIFFATFQDGCDWDRYVTPIYAEIGRARSGGTKVHIDLIEEAGFAAERVAKINTELFDQNLAELSNTLGFFFAPTHAEYFKNLAIHQQSLQKFVKTSRYGGVALSCVEELWEIKG